MSIKITRDILVDNVLSKKLPLELVNLISSYDHVFEGIKNRHHICNNTLKHIILLDNGDLNTVSNDNQVMIWRKGQIVYSYKINKPFNISRIILLKEDLYIMSIYNTKEFTSYINVYQGDEIKYTTKYDGNVIKLLHLASVDKILIGHSLGVNGIENIIRIWDYTSDEEKNCKCVGDDSMRISLRRNNSVCVQNGNLVVATVDNTLIFFDLDRDLETPICIRFLEFSPFCLTVIEDKLIHSFWDKPYICWYNDFTDTIINNKVRNILMLNKDRCAVVVRDNYDRDTIQIWNYNKRYMIFAFPEINKYEGESITLGGLTYDEKLFFITSKEDLVISNLETWKHEYSQKIERLNYYVPPILDNKGGIVVSINGGDIVIVK